jgi:hypothetical protein
MTWRTILNLPRRRKVTHHRLHSRLFRPAAELLENRIVLATNSDLAFLGRAYQDLLLRNTEPDGLAAWSRLLDQGISRADVVAAIANSSEHQTRVVGELYRQFLERSPDPTGLNSFVRFLTSGGTVRAARAALLGSPEYLEKRGGGTTDGFLQSLYHATLNRDLDTSGRTAFTHLLENGTTREQVADMVFGSPEFQQGLVQRAYQGFLHRAADDGGLAAWVKQLQNGTREEQVAAGIAGSEEYLKLPVPLGTPPFSVLTIGGRRFDPQADTAVVFTDRAGRETRVLATSVTATAVEAPVPFFVDPDSAQVEAGNLSVSVVQQTATGTINSGPLFVLPIADLPQTGAAPGAVSAAFFTQMQALLDKAVPNYQKIGAALANTVDVAPLVAQLQALRQQYNAALGLISPLMTGAVPQVNLGHIQGQNAVLNRDALALLDRLIFAEVAGQAQVGSKASVPASRSVAARAAFSAERADEGKDPVKVVSDQVAGWFKDVGSSIIDIARKNRQYAIPLIAVGVGLTAVFFPAGLPAAALLGGIAMNALTFVPAATSVVATGAGNIAAGKNSKVEDFGAAARFVGEDLTGRVVGLAVAAVQGDPDAVPILTNSLRATQALDKLLNATDASSIGTQIEKKFDELQQKLFPPEKAPAISVSPGTLSFTAAEGGANPANQTLVVTNTGPAGSVLHYTIRDTTAWLKVSGPSTDTVNSLAAGASATYTVSVNASGMSAGTYHATITVTDDKATNSPQTVPVTLTILPRQGVVGTYTGRYSGMAYCGFGWTSAQGPMTLTITDTIPGGTGQVDLIGTLTIEGVCGMTVSKVADTRGGITLYTNTGELDLGLEDSKSNVWFSFAKLQGNSITGRVSVDLGVDNMPDASFTLTRK